MSYLITKEANSNRSCLSDSLVLQHAVGLQIASANTVH